MSWLLCQTLKDTWYLLYIECDFFENNCDEFLKRCMCIVPCSAYLKIVFAFKFCYLFQVELIGRFRKDRKMIRGTNDFMFQASNFINGSIKNMISHWIYFVFVKLLMLKLDRIDIVSLLFKCMFNFMCQYVFDVLLEICLSVASDEIVHRGIFKVEIFQNIFHQEIA